MFDKSFLGFLSLVVSIVGYAPYFITIFNGKTKPHAFSWIIWTMTATLAFLAQVSRGAGHGSWVTACAVLACAAIAALSFRYGEKNITRSDEIVFGITLSAIPLWAVTQEPLWSVWLLVIIGDLGFIPTFRKTWHDPYGENAPFYVSVVIKFMLGILALDHVSWTTILYPLNSTIINTLFLAMLYWRRAKAPCMRDVSVLNLPKAHRWNFVPHITGAFTK